MAKRKIFTPEDFDKAPKSPKKNNTKWIVGAVVVIAVVLAILFAIKGCNSNNEATSSEAATPASEIVNDSNVDSINVGEVKDIDEHLSQTPEIITSQHVKIDIPQEEKISSGIADVQSNPVMSSEVESEAFKVIRGDYGNYPERKNALGDKYQSIQNRVNELKRQGVF